MGSESAGLKSLWRLLFGCTHARTTFPSARQTESADGHIRWQTCVTCLNCGEELPYDWEKMEIEGGGTRSKGLFLWLRARAERITGHHGGGR